MGKQTEPMESTAEYHQVGEKQPETVQGFESLNAASSSGRPECNAAYKALIKPGDGSQSMLERKYRINPENQKDVLDVRPSNFNNLCLSKIFGCCCCCCAKTFVVNTGYIRCGEDGSGGYPMYGPGVHFYCSPFLSVEPEIQIRSTR